MQHVTSYVYQFRGSHYEFGQYQARQLQQTNYLQNRLLSNDSRFSKFQVDSNIITSLFNQFAPFLLEEIYGLADTLEMSLEQAFIHFGGYFGIKRSGCSILMQNGFMVRNYDLEPSTYDGRYVLFQPTDGGYASVGPSMLITGRTDGMNEHGLVVGYNFVNSRQQEDGFVCNMIARIVLETCKTTEDAVLLLQQLPHKHSFNYCLLDAKGDARIVEASPRGIAVRTDIACTNHFQALTKENRYTMADSLNRHELIRAAASNDISLADAYQLLNDWDSGVFAKKYSAWDGTIHTATYEPGSLKARISFGANRMPLTFDFKHWLQGENSAITKIKGELQSNNPFASN